MCKALLNFPFFVPTGFWAFLTHSGLKLFQKKAENLLRVIISQLTWVKMVQNLGCVLSVVAVEQPLRVFLNPPLHDFHAGREQ